MMTESDIPLDAIRDRAGVRTLGEFIEGTP